MSEQDIQRIAEAAAWEKMKLDGEVGAICIGLALICLLIAIFRKP